MSFFELPESPSATLALDTFEDVPTNTNTINTQTTNSTRQNNSLYTTNKNEYTQAYNTEEQNNEWPMFSSNEKTRSQQPTQIHRKRTHEEVRTPLIRAEASNYTDTHSNGHHISKTTDEYVQHSEEEELDRDLRRLQEKHETLGYQSGMDASTLPTEAIQRAFNEGFSTGFEKGWADGAAAGKLIAEGQVSQSHKRHAHSELHR